jgi:hypothetical protein
LSRGGNILIDGVIATADPCWRLCAVRQGSRGALADHLLNQLAVVSRYLGIEGALVLLPVWHERARGSEAKAAGAKRLA